MPVELGRPAVGVRAAPETGAAVGDVTDGPVRGPGGEVGNGHLPTERGCWRRVHEDDREAVLGFLIVLAGNACSE